MSLPVSHYEALLAEVRGLRRKAQRVQLLATPLISSSHTSDDQEVPTTSAHHDVSLTNFLKSVRLHRNIIKQKHLMTYLYLPTYLLMLIDL